MTAGILRIAWSAALAGTLLAAPPAGTGPVRTPRKAVRPLRLTVKGMATTPMGPADGLLEVGEVPGQPGLGVLTFTVYRADAAEPYDYLDRIRGFHFGDFEGPDAPAAGWRLTQVTVHGPAGTVRVRLRQGGWYSSEPRGGFTFSVGASPIAKERLEKQRVFRALRAGATSLVFRVTDYRDRKAWVQGEFPLPGAAPGPGKRLAGLP